MKYIHIIWIALFVFTGCQNNDLREQFECNTPVHFTNTKKYKDVLGKFKISIPKYWKTQLYYDEFQSDLYSADTTKQLSETYLIDITWHQGELNFNEEFESNISKNLKNKGLLKQVKSGFVKFKKHETYFNLSTGKSSELTYHYLQVYLKYKPDEYYTFTSKIYGDKLINERVCASISVFNKINFIK